MSPAHEPTTAPFKTHLTALNHGITGQTIVMSATERIRFNEVTTQYIAALNPANIIESDLAESIAFGAYRLKRACALEHNIFALAHPDLLKDSAAPTSQHPDIDTALANAKAFLADASGFQLLSLYEQRIRRNMYQDVLRLEHLQSQRKATREQVVNEAALLAEEAHAGGNSYDPTEDFPPANIGFILLNAEINTAIHRSRRRDAALHLRATRNYQPAKLTDLPRAA